MKATGVNKKDRITEIENQFWKMMDLFHSIGLRNEEYFVSLFILYTYYKRVDYNDITFKEILKIDNFHKSYKYNLHNSYLASWREELLRELFDIFIPPLEKIGKKGIRIVGNILGGIDIKDLEDDFPEIFDSLLYKLSKTQGRYSGEYIMPQELSRFMCKIADLPKNAKVYNPFAGLASFRIFLDGEHDYLGQELNKTTWGVGALRILAHEKAENSKFVRGDSISDWNPTVNNLVDRQDTKRKISEKEKFDLIISEPPFNMKVPKHIDDMFGGIKTYEHFIIENGLKALNPNGKIIICVPQGLLFRSGPERFLRQDLVTDDLLEMVISFPSGLLMNTGISLAILVINKNKNEKDKVKFIDANNFIESFSSKEKRLNDNALNERIQSLIDSDTIKIVSNKTIGENDYNLNVPRYFHKDYNGFSLGQIGSIFKGEKLPEGQFGKFIKIRNLKNDKLHFNLDIDDIESVELPRNAKKIEESCVLLACRWKTLKPTFFNFSGIP